MTFIGPNLSTFLRNCHTLTDQTTLRGLLAEMTEVLGFEHFALNHHVDLAGPPADAVVLMNYDIGWVERAFTERYFIDDPIHAASMRRTTGFFWRDVPHILPLSRRQQRILAEARTFGLCEGLTIPVHVPGEYRGSCSFGTRKVGDISEQILFSAQMVGTFAFEAARRLVRAGRGKSPAIIPNLSQRQLDCLVLVAAGKSNWEISQILNLSEPTVRQHIGEAMRRYDVCKRTQLVVRALFDGQISYEEAFKR